jgi:hypothetical protein
VIVTRISGEGLRILEPLDGPIEALHVKQLGHLGPERLKVLIALLEEVRGGLH